MKNTEEAITWCHQIDTFRCEWNTKEDTDKLINPAVE